MKKRYIICILIVLLSVAFVVIRQHKITSETQLFNDVFHVLDLGMQETDADKRISETFSTRRTDKYENLGTVYSVYSVRGDDIDLLCHNDEVYSYIVSNINISGSYHYCKRGYYNRVVNSLRKAYGNEEMLNDNDVVTSCLF
jgi:hypothetical protein